MIRKLIFGSVGVTAVVIRVQSLIFEIYGAINICLLRSICIVLMTYSKEWWANGVSHLFLVVLRDARLRKIFKYVFLNQDSTVFVFYCFTSATLARLAL